MAYNIKFKVSLTYAVRAYFITTRQNTNRNQGAHF